MPSQLCLKLQQDGLKSIEPSLQRIRCFVTDSYLLIIYTYTKWPGFTRHVMHVCITSDGLDLFDLSVVSLYLVVVYIVYLYISSSCQLPIELVFTYTSPFKATKCYLYTLLVSDFICRKYPRRITTPDQPNHCLLMYAGITCSLHRIRKLSPS